MRIKCPYCGERDASEFVYGGDATKIRPDASALDKDEGSKVSEELLSSFYDYVYMRKNPRGVHEEYWYHGSGCRAWLRVTRDTSNHKVSGVKVVGDE